jgi:hypothetical protein
MLIAIDQYEHGNAKPVPVSKKTYKRLKRFIFSG